MDASAQDMTPTPFEGPIGDLPDLGDFALPAPPAPEAEAAPADQPAQPGRAVSSVNEFEAVYDVPVKVKAVLGGARIPIGELVRMRAGAVVELDRKVGEPVDVFVNDRLIARGELVLIDGLLGVTLTETVKQEY